MDTKNLLLEIYIEYLNDYLTVEKYASDKGITVAQAECVLSIGRKLYIGKIEDQIIVNNLIED